MSLIRNLEINIFIPCYPFIVLVGFTLGTRRSLTKGKYISVFSLESFGTGLANNDNNRIECSVEVVRHTNRKHNNPSNDDVNFCCSINFFFFFLFLIFFFPLMYHTIVKKRRLIRILRGSGYIYPETRRGMFRHVVHLPNDIVQSFRLLPFPKGW